MDAMVVYYIFLFNFVRQAGSNVPCFASDKKLVSFVLLFFNEILEDQPDDFFRSTASKIATSINHIHSANDRIEHSIEHEQVIIGIETALIRANAD
jgi:hypothetical protein